MSRLVEAPAPASILDRVTTHRGGGNGKIPRDDRHGGGNFNNDGNNSLVPASSSRVGLLLFLTSVIIVFAAIFSAYLVRMDLADWRSVPEPTILWLNSVILALASAVWQAAVSAGKRDNIALMHRRLIMAGALIVLFVFGQLVAWRQMSALGHPLGTGPASSFFYLITMIHGLHILGGLLVWASTLLSLRRRPAAVNIQSRVELSAIYWHVLLAVWVVMFGLMLAT